tara:strand:- start:1793 stop:2056 length:264 start_codon:yes stop_codon:yes gene_type:complete
MDLAHLLLNILQYEDKVPNSIEETPYFTIPKTTNIIEEVLPEFLDKQILKNFVDLQDKFDDFSMTLACYRTLYEKYDPDDPTKYYIK